MRRETVAVIAMIAGLAAGACDRTPPADEAAGQDDVAEERKARQDDTLRLEQRVDELEGEWAETQQKLSQQTDAAATEARREMAEALDEARQTVAGLRTTTADNWWNRYENELEQDANELEQEVGRIAPRWSPGESSEVGTTGEATGWQARRDRVVARLESRLDGMEEAIENASSRDGDERDVEDARARIGALREDTDRLKNASEDDWWDVTRDWANDHIDSLEASIDRLVSDGGKTN